MAYIFKKPERTTIKVNNQIEGEPITAKVARAMNNNEPITDGGSPVFQPPGEFDPGTDIRTDRFEVALEAVGSAVKNHLAKRQSAAIPTENDPGTPAQKVDTPPTGV